MRGILTGLFMTILSVSVSGQELLTVGLQYKPIFASRFFNAGETEAEEDIFRASIKPVWGHSYGMVIRRGFTRLFAFETGISYVKRNYSMSFKDLDSSITDVSKFGMVSYEIPAQFLVYIQLGENLYMNNAFGGSMIAFASDVASIGSENNRFSQYTRINTQFITFALIANLGFEYRTEKSGFFYFGASLHRPFKSIATTFAQYDKNNFETYQVSLPLTGAYLTADFRYFFHADPVKREKNKTKSGK
jgi:hypothetical protein